MDISYPNIKIRPLKFIFPGLPTPPLNMTRCDLVSEFSSRCIANTGCSDVICREDCNILVKLCTNNTDNTSYTVCAGLPSTQCLHLYNYLPPPFTLSNSAVYHVIVTNNLALEEDRMRGVHICSGHCRYCDLYSSVCYCHARLCSSQSQDEGCQEQRGQTILRFSR